AEQDQQQRLGGPARPAAAARAGLVGLLEQRRGEKMPQGVAQRPRLGRDADRASSPSHKPFLLQGFVRQTYGSEGRLIQLRLPPSTFSPYWRWVPCFRGPRGTPTLLPLVGRESMPSRSRQHAFAAHQREESGRPLQA